MRKVKTTFFTTKIITNSYVLLSTVDSVEHEPEHSNHLLTHFELVQGFIMSQTRERLSIQLQNLITCTHIRTHTDQLMMMMIRFECTVTLKYCKMW